MKDDACVRLSGQARNALVALRGSVCSICKARLVPTLLILHCIIQACGGNHGRQHLFTLCSDCHRKTLCGDTT